MLVQELQSLAASLGISGTARMRKGELITAITERQSGGVPTSDPTPPPAQPRTLVPAFDGESTIGEDLLGIEDDVLALAVLLASNSLTPPLALGLFAEWGSGKSFFMKSLEQRIALLTDEAKESDRGGAFCNRVVSVWFSAWHYAEGNLWASLIHHIFTSLHGDNPASPQRTLNEALIHVRGVREARAAAAAHANEAERRVKQAKTDLERLSKEHEQAREKASKIRAYDIWSAVSVDEDLRASFNDAANNLGLREVANNAREIQSSINEAQGLVGDARALLTAGRWWKSPLAVGLAIAAAISVAGLLIGALIEWTQTWLGPTVAAAAQIAALCAGAASLIARQTSAIRRILQPAQKLKEQLDERLAGARVVQQLEEAEAQQRIEASESELADAQNDLRLAREREAEAVGMLDELTGERLLRRYLAERVASADYEKYLGVVALAHRDLKDLDAHLRSAVTNPHDASIDRIVLYIDDLDRCPPDVVTSVLEAVHLLLALPLFVVVVGVDARWLARSLQDGHPLLLGGSGDVDGHSEELTKATPADYLEKIFQLSYQLPRMTSESCARLLRMTALRGQPNLPANSSSAPKESQTLRSGDAGRNGVDRNSALDSAAALTLTSREIRMLDFIASLVGSSPRRAKRFLNVYRVVKARVSAEAELAPLDSADTDQLMALIAIAVGLPQHGPIEIEKADPTINLIDWLSHHLAPTVPPSPEADRLAGFIANAGPLGSLSMRKVVRWAKLARPYTWPVGVA